MTIATNIPCRLTRQEREIILKRKRSPKRPRPFSALQDEYAFSLVELLVVLAIIVVLMSLLLPATLKFRQVNKEKQATLEAQLICKAVIAYKQTYGKWPGQTQGGEDTTHAESAQIIGALTTNTSLNPREIVFIEIPTESLLNGSFVDPWGRSYVIVMDETNDGTVRVDLNLLFSAGGATNVPGETAVVISGGADPSNPKERIYSWSR